MELRVKEAEIDKKDEELKNKQSGWSWWSFKKVAICKNSDNQ